VCIDDEQASRQHALLRCQSDGCELYDLDSRNGTWVNGVRIGQPTRLQAGDIIQLGNTSLCLVRAGD
jgi:pSer/pThr/pTyr-binding forkhead associated (FHA) protein